MKKESNFVCKDYKKCHFLQDAMQKLSALSRLRCLPEVKHFKTLETDDSLSSELVRRTALIGNVHFNRLFSY